MLVAPEFLVGLGWLCSFNFCDLNMLWCFKSTLGSLGRKYCRFSCFCASKFWVILCKSARASWSIFILHPDRLGAEKKIGLRFWVSKCIATSLFFSLLIFSAEVSNLHYEFSYSLRISLLLGVVLLGFSAGWKEGRFSTCLLPSKVSEMLIPSRDWEVILLRLPSSCWRLLSFLSSLFRLISTISWLSLGIFALLDLSLKVNLLARLLMSTNLRHSNVSL